MKAAGKAGSHFATERQQQEMTLNEVLKKNEKGALDRDSLEAYGARRPAICRETALCRAKADSSESYRDFAWRKALEGLNDFMRNVREA